MLVQQIDQSIIIALIGVLGGVLPVGITYVFAKNKEINEMIRQEKTKRYDGLINTLLRIVDLTGTKKAIPFEVFIEAVNNYIAAYHRAYTYANDAVLKRCNIFASDLIDSLESEEEIEKVMDKVQGSISTIYAAIRKDINPKSKYIEVAYMWIQATAKRNENENENEHGPEPSDHKSLGAPIRSSKIE